MVRTSAGRGRARRRSGLRRRAPCRPGCRSTRAMGPATDMPPQSADRPRRLRPHNRAIRPIKPRWEGADVRGKKPLRMDPHAHPAPPQTRRRLDPADRDRRRSSHADRPDRDPLPGGVLGHDGEHRQLVRERVGRHHRRRGDRHVHGHGDDPRHSRRRVHHADVLRNADPGRHPYVRDQCRCAGSLPGHHHRGGHRRIGGQLRRVHPTATIFNDTLANFSGTHTDWTSGLATFTAAANPTSRTLRFTVDVQNNPLAQSQSASADFTFEAQD